MKAYKKGIFPYLLGLLMLLTMNLPLFAKQDYVDKMQIALLDGDFDLAVNYGEKALALYTSSPPPPELYYFIAIAYMREGNDLRADDIYDLLLKEYKLPKPIKARIELLKFLVSKKDNLDFSEMPQVGPLKDVVMNWLRKSDINKNTATFPIYQVGAFSQRKNAERVKRVLTSRGVYCFIHYEDRLYKVRIIGDKKLLSQKIKDLGLNLRRIGDD